MRYVNVFVLDTKPNSYFPDLLLTLKVVLSGFSGFGFDCGFSIPELIAIEFGIAYDAAKCNVASNFPAFISNNVSFLFAIILK
jgi:hypothetical protein